MPKPKAAYETLKEVASNYVICSSFYFAMCLKNKSSKYSSRDKRQN